MFDRIMFIVGYPIWLFVITLSWIVGCALGHSSSWVDYYSFFKNVVMSE